MRHKTLTNQFLGINERFPTWTATALAALFLLNSGKLNAQPQFTINRLASGIQNVFGVGAGANGSVYVGTTAANSLVLQVSSPGTPTVIGGGESVAGKSGKLFQLARACHRGPRVHTRDVGR